MVRLLGGRRRVVVSMGCSLVVGEMKRGKES